MTVKTETAEQKDAGFNVAQVRTSDQWLTANTLREHREEIQFWRCSGDAAVKHVSSPLLRFLVLKELNFKKLRKEAITQK